MNERDNVRHRGQAAMDQVSALLRDISARFPVESLCRLRERIRAPAVPLDAADLLMLRNLACVFLASLRLRVEIVPADETPLPPELADFRATADELAAGVRASLEAGRPGLIDDLYLDLHPDEAIGAELTPGLVVIARALAVAALDVLILRRARDDPGAPGPPEAQA